MAADAHSLSTPSHVALDVLLLGATEVRVHGRVVHAGGPMQRGVLAMLALADGAAVTVAQLTAGLWGVAPPPSAASTLRAYLSRLRTGLASDALVRDATGYRLDRTSASCDAVRFCRVLDEDGGDPDTLAAALALWRGDVLADLRHLPFATAHGTRLEAARRTATTRRGELLVARNRHVEAVAELSTAVAAAPHDEHLVGLLARALVGAGRHADALAVLEDSRHRLRDDLGLDPGPELRALHTAVLVHDPAVLAGPAAARSPAVSTPLDPPAPPPGNVPLPLTSFVGRARELRGIMDLLATNRLVTLRGPGGCGKTRLALEAVRRLQATEGVEAWVVELAESDADAHVDAVVAEVLGVATTSTATTLASLRTALQGRRLLLVLDNCEHVVEQTAPLAAALLARCAGVQVLATSREPLGVPGEHVLDVGTMTIGTVDAPGDAERLLLDRAAAHGVTADDPTVRALVRRICLALDGIPLALELAAARCTVLSLAELAERLDDRFAVLDRGSRTALARHRTLAAAIAWSHDLLGDEEQAVLASAAAFRTSFELDDLAAVHGATSGAVLPLLGALVDKSMVVSDNRVTGTRRYRLLETIRAFVLSRLDDAAAVALADAHLHHVTGRAEEANARLRGFDDAPAWRWIEASSGDLRAAFDHAVRTGSSCAPRLVAALGWFAYRRGMARDGLRWCDLVRPLRDRAGPDVATAVVLTEGTLSYLAGDHERLPRVIVELSAAVETTTDTTLHALAEVYLAYFEAAFGDPGQVEAHLGAAEALVASGTTEPWVAAEVAMPRGQLLRAVGRPREAIAVLQEGQAAGAACGHRWAVGSLAWMEAKARLDLRQPAAAAVLLSSATRSFATQGDRTSTLAGLHTMAAAAAMLERHELGARLLGAVDELGTRIGYDPAAMDPVDAEAHRALVRFGCSEQEWEQWRAAGRGLSLQGALDLAERIATAR